MRRTQLRAPRDGDDPKETLKIGQLARRASVSVDAIRFYERRGILPPAPRRPSGYRVYRRADVDRVRMTKALQKLGFTLDEVKSALAAFDTGTASCKRERWRLQTVVGRIDAKVGELLRLRDTVVQALESCQTGACPALPSGRHPDRQASVSARASRS